MNPKIQIKLHDPETNSAILMMDALWKEIQTRYGFEAPNPMKGEYFKGPKYAFWVAEIDNRPIGSIAITPWNDSIAELDVMYVDPEFRGTGLASELVNGLELFAKENGFKSIRLRAGAPQPEALRFYEKHGYGRIDSFGKWASDETAWCYEKLI
ncbi:GNAT family N-acetyltransferase [Leptospira neocaledonica]|uniref:GNAT family N-acetyltransferase n=1 Tax=Leptospira neocaledonica TaxID=2023192 RepID=A0A2M9ZZU7_9LEPT|nr:GNAT family N-acetyltransferase [Leptospira neocaledonica]PJZ77579.1 GNAT family N-acetyltransferase [Leptospira neocaledonica]